jgi:hypothetical protein
MADKNTAKNAPEKKVEQKPTQKATPAKAGRPPKLAEITEMDLGPKLTPLVYAAAAGLGVDVGTVVRALVRKAGDNLRSTGPIGVRMALKRYL